MFIDSVFVSGGSSGSFVYFFWKLYTLGWNLPPSPQWLMEMSINGMFSLRTQLCGFPRMIHHWRKQKGAMKWNKSFAPLFCSLYKLLLVELNLQLQWERWGAYLIKGRLLYSLSKISIYVGNVHSFFHMYLSPGNGWCKDSKCSCFLSIYAQCNNGYVNLGSLMVCSQPGKVPALLATWKLCLIHHLFLLHYLLLTERELPLRLQSYPESVSCNPILNTMGFASAQKWIGLQPELNRAYSQVSVHRFARFIHYYFTHVRTWSQGMTSF